MDSKYLTADSVICFQQVNLFYRKEPGGITRSYPDIQRQKPEFDRRKFRRDSDKAFQRCGNAGMLGILLVNETKTRFSRASDLPLALEFVKYTKQKGVARLKIGCNPRCTGKNVDQSDSRDDG